ncbi:MAG: helix-turn-helix domain-containing protein [Nitrospinae bacterium]|nr:helix-turn-helix domain-containing protein [Nitrospinota bacterium]
MENLLNVEAAARYLAISIAWLNKARSHGSGPRFSKIGSRVVYRRSDLDEFLERHARTSTSGAE